MTATLLAALTATLLGAPPTIGFDNGSAEVLQDGYPVGWEQASWGDIIGNISIASGDAADGEHYLQANVLTGTFGDMRWSSPTAVPVVGSQVYILRDWYRSSTTTRLLGQLRAQFGPPVFVELQVLQPAAVWTETSALLVVPSGALTIQLAHVIDTAGSLDVDNMTLEIATPDDPEWDPAAIVSTGGGDDGTVDARSSSPRATSRMDRPSSSREPPSTPPGGRPQ